MSNTVLGFWDFFWIAFVVAVMSGGSSLLSPRDTTKLDAMKEQLKQMNAELRRLRGEPAA